MNIPRLVVVLDRAGCQLPPSEVALAALLGGADQIQLREPCLDKNGYCRIATELIEAGIPVDRLTINGHLHLATELGANLHLPERLQGTLTEPAFPALLSTSVHAESLLPVRDRFDYLIAGNVLPTASHPGRPGLGVDGFRRIVESANTPVLAIGGMEPDAMSPFMAAGAHGVGVRSYIIGDIDPEASTRQIRKELERWTN